MSSDVPVHGESPAFVPVSDDPLCRESTLSSIDTWITPTERFYIRNHFSGVPNLDRAKWNLAIDGQVRQPLTLSLADILMMPSNE